MKVIFRQTESGGGADILAHNLCKTLRKHRVETKTDFYPHELEVFPFPLRYVAKKEDCDVIHSHTWAGFVFKEEGVPLVVTENQSFIFDPSFFRYKTIPQKIYHKLIGRYIEKTLKVTDKLVCVSDYVRTMIERSYGYQNGITIHNGVDTGLFRPENVKKENFGIDEKQRVLLFVGNLTNKKGVDLLPEIMSKLGDDFLLLCCSGVRKNVVGSWSENIKLIGTLTQKQLAMYYNMCDIYLQPSRTEGFSLTIAEAMACGKPIVCTNSSALPELIVDNKGGFLCKMDEVDEFVDKISLLAEDENLREKMGVFNRRKVENKFSLDRMVDKYYRVYRGL